MTKQEIRTEWLRRLRSGDYEQGKMALHKHYEANSLREKETDDYCCLGVLCTIAVEEGVIDPPKHGPSSMMQYDSTCTILSPRVQKWAGLKTEDGQITNTMTLASANDDGASFKKIANIIEDNSAVLFVEEE